MMFPPSYLKRILFSGVLLLSFLLKGQNKKMTDSLLAELQVQKKDSNRVKTLCALSDAFGKSNLIASEQYATEALTLAEKINFQKGVVLGLNRLALSLESKGNYKSSIDLLLRARHISDSLSITEYDPLTHNSLGLNYTNVFDYSKAIEHFNKAIKTAEISDNKLFIGIALCNMGNAFVLRGLYEKATNSFLKAADHFEKIKENTKMATCFYNVGNIHLRIANYDKALSYYQKSLMVFESNSNKKEISNCFEGIGSVLYSKQNFKEAFDYFLKSLTIREEIGDQIGVVSCFVNMAALYSDMGEFDKTLVYLSRADSVNSKVHDINHTLAILNNIGYAYLNQGKSHEALSKFKEYYELAKKNNSRDDIRIASYNLSTIYSGLKNYKEAYEYYRLYSTMNDSLLSDEKKTKISDLIFNHEMERKEQEVSSLRSIATIKELQLQQSEFKIILLFFGLIFICVTSTFFYLLNKQKQKRKAEAEKIRNHEDILIAIIEAREKEQKRVAGELHDSLGQILSTLKLRISAYKDGRNDDHLDASLHLIQQASQEVKTISHDLMPDVLLELGLQKALYRLADNITKSGTLNVNLNLKDIDEKLPELTGILIYRIVQELVNNIIKHANATNATIELSKKDKHLLIHVEDNGKGFTKEFAGTSSGIGWKMLSSRILMLRGSYEIKNLNGKGTRIEIKLVI